MYTISKPLSSLIISKYEEISGYAYQHRSEFYLPFDHVREIFKLFEEINRSIRINPELQGYNIFSELSDLIEIMELEFASSEGDGTILARFPGTELDIL